MPHLSNATAHFHHDDDELHHPELAIWRANVGVPVVLDLAPPLDKDVRSFDLLSWNLAIGEGRLGEVLAGLRRRGLASRQRPLVILAQEAYRADATVPRQPGSKHHGGKGRGGERMSIVDVAQHERLSLRYAPSMR